MTRRSKIMQPNEHNGKKALDWYVRQLINKSIMLISGVCDVYGIFSTFFFKSEKCLTSFLSRNKYSPLYLIYYL